MAGMDSDIGAHFSCFVSSLCKKRQNAAKNDSRQTVKEFALTRHCSGQTAECGVKRMTASGTLVTAD